MTNDEDRQFVCDHMNFGLMSNTLVVVYWLYESIPCCNLSFLDLHYC